MEDTNFEQQSLDFVQAYNEGDQTADVAINQSCITSTSNAACNPVFPFPSTCPSCGYCPTCGRRSYQTVPYWWYNPYCTTTSAGYKWFMV